MHLKRRLAMQIQSDGQIFTNDFKSGAQPDWTGSVKLSRELLKGLVTKVKEGGEAEVRVALWDRTSKNGKEYKYARLDIPQPKKKEEVNNVPQESKPNEGGHDNREQSDPFANEDIPF
jgi:hypothetical protein